MRTEYRLLYQGREVHRGSGRSCLKLLQDRGYTTVAEAQGLGYEMRTAPRLELLFNRGLTRQLGD